MNNQELLNIQNTELILSDTVENNKYVLFPVQEEYMDIWKLYKRHEDAIWKREDIDIEGDIDTWRNLSEDKKTFIKMVLAFFAASDGIVNENISVNFANEVQVAPIRAFYTVQEFIETVHCVSADTLILTEAGYREIGPLEGIQTNIWNGEEFSNITVKYTGNSEIYKVTLNNGMELNCTPGHKWLINGKKIETKDLKIGETIDDYNLPSIYLGIINFKDHYKNGQKGLSVPLDEDLISRLNWFEGLCDAAGTVHPEIGILINYCIVMKKTQLLLTTIGVHSIIMGTILKISCKNVIKLKSMGFNPKKMSLPDSFDNPDPEPTIKIASIKKISDNEKTYCFTEPKRGTGIFNGILTGQSETYSALIEGYIDNADEQHKVFHAIENFECIKKKANWAQKWMTRDIPFATRLLAFCVVEGLFFSGSFCAIFWLKDQNINLKGLFAANEYISRDEGMHCAGAVMIFKKLKYTPKQEIVHEIFNDAVDIETEFVTESIPVDMIGMNKDLMIQYIKFVGDRLLLQLGYERLFDVKNPFDFMERMNLDNVSNFHVRRVTEYSRGQNIQKVKSGTGFETEEDF
jgi:ribonucleoside-diphosphate reductase subunit M2